MIINKENIKTLSGITTTDYDSQIDLLISQIMDSITQYCNNDFLYYSNSEYIYDNESMTIDSTTITINTDLPLLAGDFIRLYGTSYNDGLYQVKTFESGVITIETAKTLRAETIASAIIAMVKFPDIFINIMSEYVKSNVVKDGQVVKEKIHDTEIQYAGSYSNNDFVIQNKVYLMPYRKAYRENMEDIFGWC